MAKKYLLAVQKKEEKPPKAAAKSQPAPSKSKDSKPAKKEAEEIKTNSAKPKNQKSKVAQDSVEDEKEGDEDKLWLPGQRHPTPDEGEGTRVFYETMYEQKPGNRFAEKWLLDHGCLPLEKAT